MSLITERLDLASRHAEQFGAFITVHLHIERAGRVFERDRESIDLSGLGLLAHTMRAIEAVHIGV